MEHACVVIWSRSFCDTDTKPHIPNKPSCLARRPTATYKEAANSHTAILRRHSVNTQMPMSKDFSAHKIMTLVCGMCMHMYFTTYEIHMYFTTYEQFTTGKISVRTRS